MFPTRARCAKKNLLLCFDAFGTLFKPSIPIPRAYAEAAIKHGVKCDTEDPEKDVGAEFKRAFKEVSKQSPNYGKATGLGAEKWWANVIQSTFQPWLDQGQEVPQSLVDELLRRYSTKEGYEIFPDVIPFFQMLKKESASEAVKTWPWERTVVGVITNSDDRVPGILESFGLKTGPKRVGIPDQRTAEAASDDDISFVVLSYDVGVQKPEKGIFDAAVKSLEETLNARYDTLQAGDFEKLYIGDSEQEDYFGAKKAGWNALKLDRHYEYKSIFSKKGKGIMSMTVPPWRDSTTLKRVRLLKDLEALKDWYPKRPTTSSPSSSSSDDKTMGQAD